MSEDMQATVTKIIDFPAAHRNLHHEGQCSRLHGHTWTLEIHCRGLMVSDETAQDYGMVVDFADIKKAYKDLVEPFVEHQNLNETLTLPEYTTEHIAKWIFEQLRTVLPLFKVVLWEGKSSFVSIQNGDQLR